MAFPEEFVWGAAAASYQIEGACDEDGKGPSVWDMMCRWSGKVYEGNTGFVACDHYHLFREDVGIMKQIGLQAYRLSVSWPRVLPEGVGAVNEEGMAFYDQLIDELLAAGIEPWVTLFHWDYPLALYYRGGWLNRESVEWFGEYAQLLVDRLGDRVSHWMTLNEPQCFLGLGHAIGIHAPGLKLSDEQQLLATHHALMAHGKAVQVIRSRAGKSPTIGWAPVGRIRYPYNNDEQHLEAARLATYRCDVYEFGRPSLDNLIWHSDAVLKGAYPEDGLRLWGDAVPEIHPGDMELMNQPLDFFGANIYFDPPARFDADGGIEFVKRYDGFPVTLFHWPVEPDALYWGPRLIHERYGLPVVVTENGLSNPDWVQLDGKVHDPQRIDFTSRYLLRLHDAISDGIPVKGYFHWSIMDNFEWAEGFKHRFGLVHVDYQTLERTPKESAWWYRDVIASNGATILEA